MLIVFTLNILLFTIYAEEILQKIEGQTYWRLRGPTNERDQVYDLSRFWFIYVWYQVINVYMASYDHSKPHLAKIMNFWLM